MMKRSFRDKWCALLRSGEYEQARGRLMDRDGKRCCLGVAYAVDGVSPRIGFFGNPLFDNASSAFPGDDALARWGLCEKVAADLYARNDGTGDYMTPQTFVEIADIIEALPVEDDRATPA